MMIHSGILTLLGSIFFTAMSSSSSEVVHDFHPLFRVYKDGHVERFMGTSTVPPSEDPKTGVQSKDIIISPQTNVSARLFLPKTSHSAHKLPLLIYIHGGAFAIESAFSSVYHNYLNSLVAQANVVAVSIDYRLAPEHPVPACYDDSWTVLQWVALHVNSGQGPEPWLNDHADLSRVFLAGDSAGANIAHNIAVRAGADGPGLGVKLQGMILIHPFFGDDKPDKLWMFVCPESSGCDDPRLNPAASPSTFLGLGCTKVLVCIAEKDFLRERGWKYYEALRKSEWGGVVEIMETEGEGHVFHLQNQTCNKSGTLMDRVVSFINQG